MEPVGQGFHIPALEVEFLDDLVKKRHKAHLLLVFFLPACLYLGKDHDHQQNGHDDGYAIGNKLESQSPHAFFLCH